MIESIQITHLDVWCPECKVDPGQECQWMVAGYPKRKWRERPEPHLLRKYLLEAYRDGWRAALVSTEGVLTELKKLGEAKNKPSAVSA